MGAVLFALLTLASRQSGGNWPTLAAELADHDVPLPAGDDGSRRITSFSELDDDRWFAIGYYDDTGDGLLHDLHVRAFNRRSRTWRAATFAGIGSVLHLTHHGSLFYVGGHSSPSSAPLLVLREDLTLKRTLTGWEMWALDDGRVIFERGMIHFAPAHSAVLAIYDPKTNRDESFYPAGGGAGPMPERVAGTDAWIDRDIGLVQPGRTSKVIEFPVTIRRVGLKDDVTRTEIGAAAHERVTCDVRPRVPVCTLIRD